MMSAPATVTLRDRIGGRWALSWVTYVVIAAATGITVALYGPGSAWSWLEVAAPSAAAACAVLLLADVTVLRHRTAHPVAPAVVVAVGVLAGLARGGVVLWAASAFDVTIARSAAVVLAGSVLLATVAVVGLALLRDAMDRHRRQQAALVARLAALQEMTGEGAELAGAMKDAALDEMMSALDDARAGIAVPVGEMSPDDRLALAADLRRTVDEQLRPLSHRLDAAARRLDPVQVTGLRALVGSLGTHSVFPLATALVVVAVTATFAEYALGPLLVGALVWGGLALVAAAGRRRPRLHGRQMIVGALASGAASAVAVAILRVMSDEGQFAGIAVAVFITVVALTVFTSLVGQLLFDDAATARLAEEVDARQLEAMAVNRELARTSRELAQYMHGTLQANLLTIAMSVEHAAASDDDEAFARAVADARLVLAPAPPVEPRAADLSAALARAAGLWRGFVRARVVIADDVDAGMPPSRVADVERIVGEAIANARKHGGAQHVDVWVGLWDGDLCVRVSDDGAGPGGGVHGMGSAWLDFIAPDGWRLRPGAAGEGSVLEVRLPRPTSPAPAGGVR